MEKLTWSTVWRAVNELLPDQSNPRKMSKEQAQQLIRSLEKFDYVELVAVQPDNRIIAGHMRIRALKQMGRGKELIEVRIPSRSLTAEEASEYLIRSNRNVGDWDWDALAGSWDPNLLYEWGFSEKELTDNILDMPNEGSQGSEEERCTSCGQKIRKKNE